ncbi:MAG: ATP-NAD kinase family protein [Candidatus Thorarchaeota archaeon]|nr:ATP-NAD kinase family protein [Candidatus Thorarchaeota archaeon]
MNIGLLVNPIAGMGGRVGLKGTDGVVDEAIKRGASPVAPGRALEFLTALESVISSSKLRDEIRIITCPGKMGEDVAQEAGLKHKVVELDIENSTDAEDTKDCVLSLYEAEVRLLIFVGGDGTARDVLDSVTAYELKDLQVIGVPSGVKMYSGIFVVNPADAAEVVRLVYEGTAQSAEFEVMDADEKAIRKDRFIINLYGYLTGPSVPARFQGAKQASPETSDECEAQEAIAKYVIEEMDKDGTYILGPGTTVKTVTDMLKVKKTTLGVDVYKQGKVHNDVNEEKILELVDDFNKTWIIVSPIGHQGMLFGRGNQQISPGIIDRVGRDHIIVISTPSKLKGIAGELLRVDTGDTKVDDVLRGFIRVVTDYNEMRLIKIE